MAEEQFPNPYADRRLPADEGGVEKRVGEHRFSISRTIPLRTWLVVLIISISGLGLAASAVAVSSIMKESVYTRIDDELHSSLDGWASSSEIFVANLGARPPSDYVVLKIFPDGNIFAFNDRGAIPDASQLVIGAEPATVGSSADSTGDIRWRALAVAEEGITTVVAKDLNSEDHLLRRLNTGLVVISLLVLSVMAAMGYYLIRRALRPLREVERTAQAIAAGDLDRRVPRWPGHTEVGQLSQALNVMLEQVQTSVENAQAKEGQMRRFVGDASHELRTPLTSVRGYTELYRSGATQDIDRVLTKIDDESRRMSALVEDLLALTRAEEAKLDKRPVDLLELGLGVASTARGAFPGRQINIVNDTSAVPVVNGDPGRLHQVLLNLVTNGLVHGGPESAVTLRYTFSGEDVVTEVTDTGRGMEPEVAAHIFERFYREDSSRSRISGGSGLGLAIVKSLVEQHGGSIAVHSAPGEGTTFTVRLKRLRDL
ncbi:putative sensor histidine kinase TcrY [Corynebacterium occultum]|uniref:histidine kinase n=1 Tax=Corynebacterium occultum TaxID=2675219 RepID=A0A6B8W3Y3_9CORY|nr:HAMP domain-containing sensor histidine kinase [Corynebacterium occultum]QGU08254.1 putative sensor histidine kinase TcrY [Corynebacterium occultum]